MTPNATSLYLTFRQNVDVFNTCDISTIKDGCQLNDAEFDAALTELRRAGILTLSTSDRETNAIPYTCPVSGEVFHYCHKRD